MTELLMVLAALLGLVGFLDASAATRGVAFIALGCLCAIFARMFQASRYHHRERSISKREATSPLTAHSASAQTDHLPAHDSKS